MAKENWQLKGIWKKLMWFLTINVISVFFTWAYTTLGSIMSTVPQNYQWVLALAAPLMREFSVWVMLKACSKAIGGALLHNKLTVSHHLDARYAVFLSVILGGVATTESTYCLIAVDFMINIYHGLKIIRKYNVGEEG